jgi:hypothetical protein
VRARTAWLVTVPLLLVAETIGHEAVARVFDRGDARHRLLTGVVVDSREIACTAAALAVALVLTAVAGRVLAAFRGARDRPLPRWRLAAIPAVAFLVQEHVERLAHDGGGGALVASAEPAVLAGLALQLPCGVLALLLVRTLLRRADDLGFALARRSSGRLWPVLASLRGRLQASPFRPATLAAAHAGRAPPLVA